MKLSIDKDNKKRLSLFNDVAKKVEGFCPLSDKNLFYLDSPNNILEVYGVGDSGSGGAGYAQIKLDVSTMPNTPSTHFAASLQQVITSINKIKSDDVNINIEDDKITFNNTVKAKNSISVIPVAPYDDNEVEEIRNFIAEKTQESIFVKDAIDFVINDANKQILETLSSTTSLLDVNDSIEIDVDEVRAADNVCIITLKTQKGQIVPETVLFNRNISSLLKQISEIKVSSDKKYYFLGLGALGIEVLFSPKMPRYQFPTAVEVKAIVPLKEAIKLEANTEELFESFGQFQGVFESSQWRYEQVKFRYDYTEPEELHFHFENMLAEVQEFLPVSVTADTLKAGQDVEFLFPTLHLNKIKSLFEVPVTSFEFNNLKLGEDHGQAIKVECGNLKLVVAKIIE
jgi:hypothetical protein